MQSNNQKAVRQESYFPIVIRYTSVFEASLPPVIIFDPKELLNIPFMVLKTRAVKGQDYD